MRRDLLCPSCGAAVEAYRNPVPTADMIIELTGGGQPGPVVLVRRANPPLGWALPGGFVDYGESAAHAARREALEETGLRVEVLALIGVYGRPERDPRQHTITTAYAGRASGQPIAGDDAAEVAAFALDKLPPDICFDHRQILDDYRAWRLGLRPAAPVNAMELME